jgi:PhoH-like ATPase
MPDTAGGRGQVAGGHARPVHVLDTSVLLADPLAFRRFGTADVVLPVVVLDELEAKRHHAELGWSARTALRSLEEFRVHHGILHEPMPVNDDGGTLRVELNHLDPGHLPESLRGTSNDHRILAVAATFAAEGRQVTLVSKDLPLRLRASMAGLTADDYAPVGDQGDHWPGFDELTADSATIDELYSSGVADLDEARDLPCHTGLALTNGSQSVLARVHPDKRVHRLEADLELFGVRGRNAEQKVALDLMADPSIGVVSLGGAAGSSCSGPCSPSVGRTSATCRAPSRRRCRRGRPPWSTPSRRSPNGTSSRSCSRRACSRYCRSPTSGAAPSPTPG